jgi:dUTP pyrophosphatase
MSTKVKIKKLPHCFGLPSYATQYSAGIDLIAANDQPITIKAGDIALIPTGIAIALPFAHEAQIRPRSGLAAKHLVTVANAPGTIDSDYRGEIKVILINLGKQDFIVEKGMRIAQMVVAKYEQISWEESDSLEETTRGEGGFGSTGQ